MSGDQARVDLSPFVVLFLLVLLVATIVGLLFGIQYVGRWLFL